MPQPSDPPPSSGPWTAVHLFHQGDLDTLLLEAVVPALTGLAREGRVRGHFFLRYWEGGPHLRVRILSAPPHGTGAHDTARQLVARWNTWLRDHPSPRSVDEAAYLGFADQAAAREGLSGYEPWRALHDHAETRPYLPEHDRYGTGASLAAVERHFMEASDSAEALLARRPAPAERLSAGLAVVLLTWAVVEPDPRRRLDALTSGARAWRRMLGPAYDTEAFDRAYARARPALVRRAGQLLDPGARQLLDPEAGQLLDPGARQLLDPEAGQLLDPGARQLLDPEAGQLLAPAASARPDGPAGPVAAWHDSISRLHTTLRTLEAAGSFTPDLAALRDDPSLLALPSPRAALTANRCAHLMCNRLGLYGPQEALLRHLAARAAADLHTAEAGGHRP
ncbi:lantibiotic dehydratase C-terminal domain-containing protein [Streptomyces sparsogenes]|uniref:lantibiotic dehydratase C-terminal domain-containing protein n=1 Tax=Streptomyces sparsogenes TaxID=67365 RepID=UPI0033E32867